MNFYRDNLEVNEEKIIPMFSQNITILNVGPGDAYVNFNGHATLDSLLIPAGMGRTFRMPSMVRNVHAITDTQALIQIDGMG